jgi:hypothetical protein
MGDASTATLISYFITGFELGDGENTTKDNKTQHSQKTSYNVSALSTTYEQATAQRCVFRFR